jgi:2'-5' RNA ligase
MISIVALILEGQKQKHDYGCVMLYFNFPEIKSLQDQIDDKDLYVPEEGDLRTYGKETDPHCTLLYGLHEEVTLDQVKQALKDITFSDCKLYNVSKFDNPKYDVLKFDVGYATRGGDFLNKANKALSKLPFTSEYPDYHAHSTVAYLKKGAADKYIKALKEKEYTLTPKYGIYSVPSGDKHKIAINIK